MGGYKWIEKLNSKDYLMPFVIETDQCYKKALENKLNTFCEDLISVGADNRFIIKAEELSKNICDALNDYYKGNIWE